MSSGALTVSELGLPPSPQISCPQNWNSFLHSACRTHSLLSWYGNRQNFSQVTIFLSTLAGSEGILRTNCSLQIQPHINWHSGATWLLVSSQSLQGKHSWCCLSQSQYIFCSLSHNTQTNHLAGCKSFLLQQGLSVIKGTKSPQSLLPHTTFYICGFVELSKLWHTQVIVIPHGILLIQCNIQQLHLFKELYP
jgi:hypothetical protein